MFVNIKHIHQYNLKNKQLFVTWSWKTIKKQYNVKYVYVFKHIYIYIFDTILKFRFILLTYIQKVYILYEYVRIRRGPSLSNENWSKY